VRVHGRQPFAGGREDPGPGLKASPGAAYSTLLNWAALPCSGFHLQRVSGCRHRQAWGVSPRGDTL